MIGLVYRYAHAFLILCWRTEIDGFINDYNSPTLNYTTHKWFAYLEHPLETSVGSERQCVASNLMALIKRIDNLVDWCFPALYRHPNYTEQASIITNTLLVNLPCGYLHIHNTPLQSYSESLIQVNQLFFVQLLFLVFNMDDSGPNCEHSACEIQIPKYNQSTSLWLITSRLCGQRKPWNQTLQSNSVLISVDQLYVRNVPNITFMYFPLDINVAYRSILYSNVVQHQAALKYFHESSYLMKQTKIFEIQQWVINVNIGFQIQFWSIEIDSAMCSLKLYDGPQENDLIYQGNATYNDRIFKLTTMFFQSLIILECGDNFNNNIVGPMTLLYKTVNIKPSSLTIGTTFRIISSGRTIQNVYSLKSNKEFYPNISLGIHKFHGWNDGGCNFGGYIIKQTGPKNQTLGPFCSKDFRRYLKPHGLEYFVIGKHATQLIIYSYSSLYCVDIDFIVRSSVCEGVLEPIIRLFPHNKVSEQSLVLGYEELDSAHLSLTELTSRNSIIKEYKVTVTKLSKCLTIQSVTSYYNIFIRYEIVHTMKLFINIVSSTTYLNNHYNEGVDSGHYKLRLIGIKQSSLNVLIENADLMFVADFTFASALVLQARAIKFQHKSFTINFTPVQKYPPMCTKANPRKMDYRYAVYLVGLCGEVFNKYTGNHAFTILVGENSKNEEQTFLYAEISTEDCDQVFWRRGDMLTITTKMGSIHHIVDFLVEYWQLQSHDRDFVVEFYRGSTCGQLHFHYRIEIATRRTSIGMFKQGVEYIKVWNIEYVPFVRDMLLQRLNKLAGRNCNKMNNL